MRHAYLIIAHNEFEMLQTLVSALDAPWADIYVHIDRKCKSLPVLHTEHSRLDVFSKIDVRWGDYSEVECEYALFERASANGGGYGYYHLLSGVDLPIKPKQYIHDFFEANKGKEFIDAYPYDQDEVERKVRYYHLFPGHFRNGNILLRAMRAGVIRLEMLSGLRRNKGIEFKKGAQWVSITDDFLKYLISQKDWVRRHFHHTFCADEIFLQTVCWNSPFRDKAFKNAEWGNGNMRLIDWSGGYVHTMDSSYLEQIKASNCLFARKFSSKNSRIVESIKNITEVLC